MRLEFAGLPEETGSPYHVCVVGSGPAGMTVALRLAERGRRVLLLEAGGEDWTGESQDAYLGRVVGDTYFDLDAARLRYMGGSSNHWSGWCRHLDEIDFGGRAADFGTAWPIAKADLDPYLAEASAILEIDAIPDDEVVDEANGITRFAFAFSPPVNFRDKYAEFFAASDRADICLEANVTGFRLTEGRLTALEVGNYAGERKAVAAETFVLAMGGIENSRLLLWGDRQAGGGLTDPASPLGAYWMEHPHFVIGEALVSPDLFPERTFFALTAEKQNELGILGCGLRLMPLQRAGSKGIIKSLACVAPGLAQRAAALLDRKLICGAIVRAAWEQAPVAANRVALADGETDRFGVPRPVLHWTKTEQDRKTALMSVTQFGSYVAEADLGRVRIASWLQEGGPYPEDEELAGFHHMGGTRMATSPEGGVVDADCRVFGRDNLYVAGSSVFPSGGHANPTLTIVQLSLRLADHLAPA